VDLAAWLRELGLERYEQSFRDNKIDARTLPHLTAEDLKELGVNAVGHRRLLFQAIAALSESAPHTTDDQAATASAVPGPSKREAERRQLTVLFCDLVGSTELAGQLDPEDMSEIIRAYQNACAEVVQRWDGHVAKFMGDGVLVYFGYPKAHEDDAERAVRAGLELVEAIARLAPQPDVRLRVRIGVATGRVVVGDLVGEGASREESVVGETPNLAARLQTLAEPGDVVISGATRRLVGGLFELDDLGPQRLKGFAEPLTVWRVSGESISEGRFEARHAAALTSLVGREEEIALLLRRWKQARGDEGQVVLLSGEPGIGKSRIIREVRERLAGEVHLRLSYQCSPHHDTSPLFPVIEQLERAAGFERDDTAGTKLDKLESLLARGADKLGEAMPLVAALLSVPVGERYPSLDLTPQRQKQRTLEVLMDQLEGLAAEQPVLLVYEDVHWIDPTSLELLELAIERTQRLPVLLLITFRPEFQPPWTGQSHVTALSLTRLGRREGAAMVGRMVGDKALPPEVTAQIIDKTDGVPLFVEELTKMVLESGLLSDAGDHFELTGLLPPLAIPASLHDSLLARLDRLAPVKEVAQIGAVIGRDFSHELLAAVADRPDERLRTALDQLVSSELVFRRGALPDVTYTFKHALVRDAAYESLLKSRRQQLHARIAQTLCEQFIEQVETSPEFVAEHFTRAALHHEAARYWLKAGERAKAAYANREAVYHLEKCLSILSHTVETSATHVEATALALLGDLAGLAGNMREANLHYDRALTRCRDHGLRAWISNKRHHPAVTHRDGAKIAFYRHGSGPETLLLVNPIVYGLAVFQPILERLCQDFQIVTVDCRGTGDSDPLTRPFSLREHAKDVAAVIEALDHGPVIGVGISRGSNLLIMLAVLRPQLVSKLVTVGCPLAPPGFGVSPTFSPTYLRQRAEAYEKGDIEALLRIQASFVYTESGTEELKRLAVERRLQLPSDTVLSFYDPDPDADITPLLKRLTIPTLVTHGTTDELVSFAAAEYLARELPNAQLYGFQGKGHLPIFTATGEFCDVLRRFVCTGRLP
jgi:class 3 adenylate cyclase/pimeloyl-ACP methyl ester carboxylesterase